MPERPQLLVFDLDGTLVDSSRDLCASINAMLAELNRPALPSAVIASFIGDGAAMLVRRALGDSGDIDSSTPTEADFKRAFSFFIAYYRAHKLDTTALYPGVLEALRAIRAAAPELPIAVLTNKPVGPSRGICDALGITPFIFANYGGDSFPAKKPDPHGLRTIIAEASALTGSAITPAQTVMIGDSDIDVLTARAIGARTVGCLYGLAPHTLQLAQPDILVESAGEWPSALGFAS